MIRIQRNVPSVYIDESRDFQLLCRLWEVWFAGAKNRADSIPHILDPDIADDSLLELLCTRVGFFPRIKIDAAVLREIIKAFPFIVKKKGTKEGIEQAVYTILKAEEDPRALGEISVEITTRQENGESVADILISTQNKIYNKDALQELLRYVIPFGFIYSIQQYSEAEPLKDDTYKLDMQYKYKKYRKLEVIDGEAKLTGSDLTDAENLANFAVMRSDGEGYTAFQDTSEEPEPFLKDFMIPTTPITSIRTVEDKDTQEGEEDRNN